MCLPQSRYFVNNLCLKGKDTNSILLCISQMFISYIMFHVLLKNKIGTWFKDWLNSSHGFQWMCPFTWKVCSAWRKNGLNLSNKVPYLGPGTLPTFLEDGRLACSHFHFKKVLISQLTYYMGRRKGHSTCWVPLKSSQPLSCLYLFGPCLPLCGLVVLRISCGSDILCYIHSYNEKTLLIGNSKLQLWIHQ